MCMCARMLAWVCVPLCISRKLRASYCNAVLYGVSDHNINRLQRVQNNLARVVCTAPYRTSVTGLRRSLHWLPIRKRITYKISVMTYKVSSLRKPAYLDELITNYEPTRLLRSSDKMLLTEPRTRTMVASRAFGVTVPRTWNGLPLKVRTAASIDTFCNRLKTHLFCIAYD